MHAVGVLALDGVVPFELSIPSRIFGVARDGAGRRLYTVTTCSLDGRPVRAEADYALTVSHDASLLAAVRHRPRSDGTAVAPGGLRAPAPYKVPHR
jgi:transcriptional regulator GlxA family with amidase domain